VEIDVLGSYKQKWARSLDVLGGGDDEDVEVGREEQLEQQRHL